MPMCDIGEQRDYDVEYPDAMSGSEADQHEADLDALKALQADATELEHIASLLDRFNVFETIGFVSQEVMHSRFLAFLLDPQQSHGLGNSFLEVFLRMVSMSTKGASLPSFDITGSGDLDRTRVRTEVYTGDGRIDILLLNEAEKWAMIIENKVWTFEHHDQLDRYYRFVEEAHPSWQILGVYLTPFGQAPTHGAYLPFNYSALCEIVDGVLRNCGPAVSQDVRVSMEHYTQMVRRRIVADPEIINLCRDMYRKHQRAFDLVYKYRPEPPPTVRRLLAQLINNTDELVFLGNYTNLYIYFHPQAWGEAPALNIGKDRHHFFRFVFHNYPDQLVLFLETSLGEEATRRRLYEMGQKDKSLFSDLEDPDTEDYPKLYKRIFLTPEHYEKCSDSEREQEIRRQWSTFLDKDLPQIEAALKKETWIWESVEPDPV
jgi:hypothetical protein